MQYLDRWIWDRRPRLRVFFIYFLIFVLFFIFSDLFIFLYAKSAYKPIEDYQIETAGIVVSVDKAEATNANGYVKGVLTNVNNQDMENMYLKFDFYTPRDIRVGTKYLRLDILNEKQEQEYEVGFRYDTIDHFKITLVSKEDVTNATADEFDIDPTFGTVSLLGGILWMYLFF